MKHLIYLASPHTHADPAVVDLRFKQARVATVNLMRKGFIVYSPIVYTHPLWRLSQEEMPGSILKGLDEWKHEDWIAFDKHMMDRCDECLVLQIEGWETSVGVKMEMEYFISAGKPISYVTLWETIRGN